TRPSQWKPRKNRGAEGGARSWEHLDRNARSASGRNEVASRVGDTRHPGVAGHGDDAGAGSRENALRDRGGVLLAVTDDGAPRNAEAGQQPPGDARVLGNDGIRFA